MINLFTDISYKTLYPTLLKMLQQPPQSVFAESWIVVPNHSAKQWLQKSLARDLGVCAQIKFILPLSFNWEIIKNVNQQQQEINVFTTDVLRWQVFELLNNDVKYEFLKQNSDLKNFNLAERIAQTLLKYNEEHPHKIAKWDSEIYEILEQNQWQIELWQQLQDKLPTKSPVELLQLFDASKDFKQQPENIILFATEQLTNLQKATILKLSKTEEIQLFLTNPCPSDYWFDLKPKANKARQQLFNTQSADIIDVGNPLLSNLGFNKMAVFDAFLNEDIYLHDNDSQIKGTSLLQSLKLDIAQLKQTPESCEADNSIKIHSCHNRKREIEIIKDEILKSLDNDRKLMPEEIIIVAPDINDYVQHIKDVFYHEKSQYLPFHIDRVQLADNHYIKAFMQLLESFNQEMSAPIIFELLSQRSIQQKFSINESDLPRIKNWIIKSNIRNYFSKQHKQQLGFQAKITNTWQFGKNRWLSGFLAGDVDDSDYLSTYGDIAGQDQMFSQIFEFINLWYQKFTQAQKLQTPQQWFTFLQELGNEFLYNEISDDSQQKILKQLENKFISQPLNNQQTIPLTIVSTIVEAVITENNYRSEGQIGIRIQTWENAFIIDAKVLIIIGLNDGEFPKKQIKNDLDIYSKTPSRLNKSTRARDKNLMLTALTENTEKLIMSYIGFDANNSEVQPPSVILAEIISYLEQKTSGKFKLNMHKMHGYNQHYFSTVNNSYNQNQFQLAQSFYNKTPAVKPHEIKFNQEIETTINLTEFIKYFADPLDYFLKNRAHIKQPIYQDLLQDTECYHPQGLESWQLKQEIFKHGISSAAKTGIISDNKSAQAILSKYDNDLSVLQNLLQDLQLQKHMIDYQSTEFNLYGIIEVDNKQQLISVFPTTVKAKSICQHWIKHLCHQSKLPSTIYFEDASIQFNPIANSQELLLKIFEKWQQSFSQPWLFCPPELLKVTNKSMKFNSKEQYLQKFIHTDRQFPSEGKKYFLQQVTNYQQQEDSDSFLEPIISNTKYL